MFSPPVGKAGPGGPGEDAMYNAPHYTKGIKFKLCFYL